MKETGDELQPEESTSPAESAVAPPVGGTPASNSVLHGQLTAAINLATLAHAGQIDRAGQPYILHPLRVMLKTTTRQQQIVAVLHDILEDTETTIETLENAGIAAELIRSIVALTKTEGEDYPAYLQRVARDPVARTVKLADLEDNLNVLRLDSISPSDAERLDRYVKAHARLSSHQPTE
jgi:(p)ppGpp synthase/HD superfamily hydrolase